MTARVPRVTRSPVGALALVVALGAAGCAALGGDDATTPTSVPATTAPTTTTTTLPAAGEPPVYRPGAEGPEVAALQQRLVDMKYDLPAVDGHYGDETAHAVMAFQKVHGLARDGLAGPETLETLASIAGDPLPLVPDGDPDRVEVDLARQLVLLYQGGALVKIVSASSGNGEEFCSEGRCRIARTPPGVYKVGHRQAGWQSGPLGRLYNPLYFNGNIALHGSTSVPAGPASHGCVRVPMHTAEWLPLAVPSGMRVYVVEG